VTGEFRTRHRPASSLLADLYELSMGAVYHAEGMEGEAVFELFFRELPPERNYVLACGQEEVVRGLADFRLAEDEIEYLRGLGGFPRTFIERLAKLRFSGDLYAVPEGTVMFPFEPVIQVRAPLLEAQIIETFVLNRIHGASVLATKAARVITAAEGRPVMDFGARKARGSDGALSLARAAWIAGAAGTSNVEAGFRYGIPVMGTMAHSYVQAHEDELRAFRAFVRQWPDTTLLVDTWDTLRGVDRVIALSKELGGDFTVSAIRLDSGDLDAMARAARKRLDDAGLEKVRIVASSTLNEYRIRDLVRAGAPIDGFGVGTDWAVSRDAPDIDFAYKLSEYAGQPRMKASEAKLTYPGVKQVWRRWDGPRMTADRIGGHDEKPPPGSDPLLRPVIDCGELLPGALPSLEAVREHAASQLKALPAEIRALEPAEKPYPVEISPRLLERQRELLERLG
jgi:nicotinate phosphoribosyltransferase